jgi:hypothetical protein
LIVFTFLKVAFRTEGVAEAVWEQALSDMD